MDEPESKAELTRRGVRAIEILNDPNLTGWLARLREKILAVFEAKKSGSAEHVEAFQMAYQKARTQALYQYLQRNPDTFSIWKEAREAIASVY